MAVSWYLVASSGSGFQLIGPSITIGRAADNDIVIDDNTVSRHHARLDMQASTYILTDLGSANGTWVNGRRLSAPVVLQAGDSIRFGERAVFAFSTQPSLGGVAAQEAGQICPACGAPIHPGVRFCGHCGQPLGVPLAPRQAGGLPGWILAVGGVLMILVFALVAALIALVVLPARSKPAPATGIARTPLPSITAIPLSPTPMPTETSTVVPTETPTPIPPTPTPAAWVQTIATAKANPPVFGPESGTLLHEEDSFIEKRSTDVDLRDFVVEAIFHNPYPTTKGDWDIGFLFRDAGKNDEFRLDVESNGDWDFRDRRGDEGEVIHQGRVSNLDVSANGSNRLTLLAEGNRGFFFVNDVFIAELDLSGRTGSGDISIAIGISGNTIAGEATAYEDFAIWALAAPAQQATGAEATDTPVAPPTPTRRPAGVGQIAFVSYRDGNAEIYVMNPDGSNQRRLTNTSAEEWHPAWSPDGTRIVFQCMSGGASNVCVVNADGSGYTQITNWTQDEGLAQRPGWSPDGSKIVVTREVGGGQKLVVMNADGSGQREISVGRDPNWSPDGTRIAFVRWEGGGLQIWTTSPDGSDVVMLTQGDHDHMYPTWSPDGSQIAFEYDRAQVAVMDAGGGPPRIIAGKGSYNLSWAPDGSKLVIAPSQEGLWLVNADGSGLIQIAQEGTQPSWQAVP